MATFAGITLRQGDDYSKVLTITNDSGTAIDITGATLTFHLRAPGATTDAITPAPTLTLTTPASGIATLVLTNVQTAALTADSDMRYEIEVVDATAKVSTPVYGLCFVQGGGG
jgi:hypothetical protein